MSLLLLATALSLDLACRLVPLGKIKILDETDVRPGILTWNEILSEPVEMEIRTEIAATWSAARRDLINLKHPGAELLKEADHSIAVLVHIVSHPDEGDFLIDTGVDSGMTENGKPAGVKGLPRWSIRKMEPKISVKEIIEQGDLEVVGVMLTHAHLDHVMGLADIPLGTPVYTGPGELKARRFGNGLMFRSYRKLFPKGRNVLEFDPTKAVDVEGILAVDILGDNSIWALLVPGHTPGSVAYLVNAAGDATLFVGDTSQTLWGWNHNVEPGKSTADHEKNAASLGKLKDLVEYHAGIWPVMGHELPEGDTEGDTGDTGEEEFDGNIEDDEDEDELVLEDDL